MKKIKIMLLSLLVIGAVGGAFAFKARTSQFFCGTQNSCSTLRTNLKITDTDKAIQGLFCSDQSGTDCPYSVTTDN